MIAMHMVGSPMWIFGFFWLLIPLVLVGAVVGLVAWAVRRHPGSLPERSPLLILEERFARGDIDLEEFESRRRVLQG